MAIYTDLLIINDDLALNDQGAPLLITDRACIAQDIKHMVRESGLLVQLVGQRNRQTRAQIFNRLKILIDTDSRLIPGTVAITDINTPAPGGSISQLYIVADSREFGLLEIAL